MTSSLAVSRNRGSCAIWIVLVMGLFMVTLIAGATLAMSPSLAFKSAPRANTAVPLSWAAVNIAKPTYTPSPIPTGTPTPPPTETPTSAPALQAVIVPTETATIPVMAGSQDGGQASIGGKYILVSISDQHLLAYENGQVVYSFVASTGQHNATRTGTFSVLDKIDSAYGATWDIWMPNWMGIYYAGTLENGIHALPILPDGNRLWAGYLGTPISFGCVVLGTEDALQLYNWADIGTPVEIRW